MIRITFYFLFFWAISITAQSSWKKLDSKSAKNNKSLIARKSNPKNFNLYSLNTDSFKETIASLKTIAIPNASGETSVFNIKESSNFTNKVAEEYGQITSYSLVSVDNSTTKGKISIGSDGVHVMILSNKASTFYIDPYTEDKSTYITYSKNDLSLDDGLKCLVDEKETTPTLSAKTVIPASKTSGDGSLRIYRLALACTGEYSEFHYSNNDSDTAKKASVLSAMNTTITRVNGIFEKDLGVKMEIVLNNDGENELIFLDSENDNLSNNNTSSLINESQTVCDAIIGTNNYDIGHTFCTSNDGLASVGVICANNSKAQGVTGSSSPEGDAFDVDFVAHEIGHQFGANHTFNNSCNGNRFGSTAIEPGSGSTIMSYAGICTPNIQNNVDDYFHAVSLEQMWTVIENTNCALISSTGNTAPIANAGIDVSVPKATPLILKGKGTDGDGDLLTYTWEQTDNEIATMPPLSTNIAGPAFASLPPSTDSNRNLPALSTVISGSTQSEWEVIPSVARTMNFTLTVRDNNENAGAFAQDDLSINFIDTTPFTVTSQNTTTTWEVGTNETITWDKSTTDLAPINCENVSIKLSINGGFTFPITLVESTPNDGSYDIVVPNQLTSNARIMVEAVDNIFYNVNTVNFTIQSSGPTFVLSNTSEIAEICLGENNSIEYVVNADYINSFSETVTFSLDNLPSGANAELSTTTINDSDTITITINNLENLQIGTYAFVLNGLSNSISSILELPNLSVLSNTFESVENSYPTTNATINTITNLDFQWEESSGNANLFDLEIATDSDFTTGAIFIEDITTSNYTLGEALEWNTNYYWRIKPKNNCMEGEYSEIFEFNIAPLDDYCNSFFTETEGIEYISNVSFGAINKDSDLDENGYGDYTSITSALKIGETYNLSISFNDPEIYQNHFFVFIDWNNDFYFDPSSTERYDLDDSNNGFLTTTKNITVPMDAHQGDIRMRVVLERFSNTSSYGTGACNTDHNSEYGETEDYTLRIIEDVAGYDDVFGNFLMFPNPITTEEIAANKLHILFDIPDTDKLITLNFFNIYGELIANRNYESLFSDQFNQNINLDSFSAGVYILNIQNGSYSTTKKIIVR